jgi:hypothetical protein
VAIGKNASEGDLSGRFSLEKGPIPASRNIPQPSSGQGFHGYQPDSSGRSQRKEIRGQMVFVKGAVSHHQSGEGAGFYGSPHHGKRIVNADPDLGNLPFFLGFLQLLQPAPVEYSFIFPAADIMEKNEIDPVRPQTAQAPFQFRADSRAIPFIHLGGKIEFFAPFLQGLPDFFFTVPVTVCRIYEVDPAIQSPG